jgi:hypothetical protein
MGSPVETLDVVATHAVARLSRSRNRSVVAATRSDEPAVERWPGWTRLAVLIGGSAALWAGLAWVALRILKLG